MENNNTQSEERMEVAQEQETSAVSPQLVLRDPTTRPAYKLSVKLIDTYKFINKVR
jgi:hypothetical protein